MDSVNVDIARTYLHLVQTADVSALSEFFDEAVVWHQPGAHRFSGEYRGRAAVLAMLGRMMEVSENTFAIDRVQAPMARGDLVAVVVHFSGCHGGVAMSMEGVVLLRMADCKITEVWLFSEDPVAEDAFWG